MIFHWPSGLMWFHTIFCLHSYSCHVEKDQIFFRYSSNVDMIFKEYFITPRMEYLVMWKSFFPCVMDEWYLWMKMGMKNENGRNFSWTFATSFILQKIDQKKHGTRNLCWFIVNNPSHGMFKLHLNQYFIFQLCNIQTYKI
jgi:hypothetical protein